MNKIFLVQCCVEPQRQHYIGFPLCNVVPGVLRQYYTGLFLVYCCLEPQGQHCKVLTWTMMSQRYKNNIQQDFSCVMWSGASRPTLHRHNVVPGVLRHRTGLITVHYLLILHSTFSCALLSGASRIILHGVLTCAIFSQGY